MAESIIDDDVKDPWLASSIERVSFTQTELDQHASDLEEVVLSVPKKPKPDSSKHSARVNESDDSDSPSISDDSNDLRDLMKKQSEIASEMA